MSQNSSKLTCPCACVRIAFDLAFLRFVLITAPLYFTTGNAQAFRIYVPFLPAYAGDGRTRASSIHSNIKIDYIYATTPSSAQVPAVNFEVFLNFDFSLEIYQVIIISVKLNITNNRAMRDGFVMDVITEIYTLKVKVAGSSGKLMPTHQIHIPEDRNLYSNLYSYT